MRRAKSRFTPLTELPPDTLVGGLDEVAMASYAGPIVACVTVFRAGDSPIPGVTDSKKLSKARREVLKGEILDACVDVGFGWVDAEEIDQLGVSRAHNKALVMAVNDLEERPDKLYVDGNKYIRDLCPAEFVIKGDLRIWIIGAASILAKQEQVLWMNTVADRDWPQYGFGSHHGYGTQKHADALGEHGPCPIHRRCFRPIAELLE